MDIVERLRDQFDVYDGDKLEAADEIERLREALQLIADPLRGPDVTHYLVVASYQSIARNALGGSDV